MLADTHLFFASGSDSDSRVKSSSAFIIRSSIVAKSSHFTKTKLSSSLISTSILSSQSSHFVSTRASQHLTGQTIQQLSFFFRFSILMRCWMSFCILSIFLLIVFSVNEYTLQNIQCNSSLDLAFSHSVGKLGTYCQFSFLNDAQLMDTHCKIYSAISV